MLIKLSKLLTQPPVIRIHFWHPAYRYHRGAGDWVIFGDSHSPFYYRYLPTANSSWRFLVPIWVLSAPSLPSEQESVPVVVAGIWILVATMQSRATAVVGTRAKSHLVKSNPVVTLKVSHERQKKILIKFSPIQKQLIATVAYGN